jgi:hypothetical protein
MTLQHEMRYYAALCSAMCQSLLCASPGLNPCAHLQARNPDALQTPTIIAQLRALDEARQSHAGRAVGLAQLREVVQVARQLQDQLQHEAERQGLA